MIGAMLRMLTAGESHGRGLVVIVEGLPGGRASCPAMPSRGSWPADATATGVEAASASRPTRSRSRRASATGDEPGLPGRDHDPERRVRGEVRGAHGRRGRRRIRPSALTRPRPGHADLVGAQKYGFDDVRNVLERASARETAARVAVGRLCKAFLAELGVGVLSHVVQIGSVKARRGRRRPSPPTSTRSTRRPCGAPDADAARAMVAEIDRLRRAKDTRRAASSRSWPTASRRARLVRPLRSQAGRAPGARLMSIQSVKGVEVGDGFASAARPGSKAHDEIVLRSGRLGARDRARRRDRGRHVDRPADPPAGGDEAVLDGAQPLRHGGPRRPESRRSAIKQRTDVCAVPAGGVVGEAVVAFSSRTRPWRSSAETRS